MEKKEKKNRWYENAIYIIILAVFSLWGYGRGGDLSDTTYSLANYRFMDEMTGSWKYATFLSNLIGSVLLKLSCRAGDILDSMKGDSPRIDLLFSMWFMNIFTAVLLLAVVVVIFFSMRKVIPTPLLFLGLLTAIGLCLIPKVILYQYLSFYLFALTCILLLYGIRSGKNLYYIIAGIVLGINLFVRISNGVEVLLIVWVWYGEFLKKDCTSDKPLFKRILSDTLLCVAGYAAGVLLALIIFVIYALSNGSSPIAEMQAVIEWVMGLLSGESGSSAGGYSMGSMILVILDSYLGNLKWALLLMSELVLGMLFFKLVFPDKASVSENESADVPAEQTGQKNNGLTAFISRNEKFLKITFTTIYAGGVLLTFAYLERNGMFNFEYWNTGSIYRLYVVFLIISIVLFVISIAGRQFGTDEKLLSFMSLMVIFITPLGTNNHLYAVMNNSFLIVPVAFFIVYQIVTMLKGKNMLYPFAVMFLVLTAALVIQSMFFGMTYTFKDCENGEKERAGFELWVPALAGMEAEAGHADAVNELCFALDGLFFDTDRSLYNDGLIAWGPIPGLHYVQDVPPALSTFWPSLDSYSGDDMFDELMAMMAAKKHPVVIASAEEAEIISGIMAGSKPADGESAIAGKRLVLGGFLIMNGYEEVFSNAEFTVYY